jgi:hypothetical protein
MLSIAVVDAQGGGLGAAIIKNLREKYGERINIIALGANGLATAAMKKCGANACATGENAVCYNVKRADIVMGGLGIIAASGMMGEITPEMAKAIAECEAEKILIPVSKCNLIIPGLSGISIKELIEKAVEAVGALL